MLHVITSSRGPLAVAASVLALAVWASGCASTRRDLDGDVPRTHNTAGPRTGSPADAGPFTTTTTTTTLHVPGGWTGRTVALTIVAPVAAPVAPVVVFHPGFLLEVALYASYAEHLASQGFVVVLVAPPMALVGGPTHAELAVMLSRVLDWVTTESGAGHALAGIADPTRIGLAGHSLGGKIALLLATTDARVQAVFCIDPVDVAGGFNAPSADYPSVTPELMGAIRVPIVVVGETLNSTCSGLFCQACAPAADNFAQVFAHASGPALELTVAHAGHMSFVDNPQCGLACSVCPAGSDDTATTRRITRRAMNAFFAQVLLHDDSATALFTGAVMQADVDAGLVTLERKNGFE
jgi:dienelactone hydrolase